MFHIIFSKFTQFYQPGLLEMMHIFQQCYNVLILE